MEEIQFNTFHQNPETLGPDSSVSRAFDWEKVEPLNQEPEDSAMNDEGDESLVDSMLCDSRSRLIPSGYTRSNSTEECVMFVNAGGEAPNEVDSITKFVGDTYYEGGDVLRTNEPITEAGDCPFIYQSARLGNFCYRFNDLPPGNYLVDLHFVEIINTNGPKGMRVFNVYIQEEKVLSDFDVYSVVGANKPLQLVDVRVSMKEDGVIVIRFEGVIGSPVVSGICIRKAPKVSVPQVKQEYLKCNKCAAEIEVPSAQKKLMQTKSTIKYEKKIEELTMQCQRKKKECYEAWMSLTAANEQLEKVRMELDNVTFKTLSLDQTVEKQAENLRNISSRYEYDKKHWAAAINNLHEKIKVMKREHAQLSYEAHDCADSIPELNKMVFAVQALVAQCEDLKVKYSEEQAKRRKLFNEVQEAKGNIRVFCRCRPLSKEEILTNCTTVVDFDAAKDGCLGILAAGSIKKSFKFDRVYTPKDDQVDVFADASPMVTSVLDGYNVCIFAYGQTGTGKTFTMEGTDQNRGVNYRTLELLFKIAKERSETFTYDLSVSVLEVYNEQIRDLLATSPTSKKLEIRQASEGFHHVLGIVEAKVDSIREVWSVLQAGSNARAVGSNNVNEHSSRSHCMLCIMVRAKNLMNGECTKSKLWLVDLAGSERLAKTDVQGERLKEAQNINRSLSALGDVISALATKSSHIPYRNSKLTHLLQDSLGGDSKTLMFVQISPSDQDSGETLSSLNFASRVRGIELGPAKKQIDTSELQKVKAMLEKARQESKSKDESLRKLEENLQNLESKAKGKDQFYKNLQEKIKELEGQIELKKAMHSQSEKQVLQLSERLRGREEICSNLQQKVKELEIKFIGQEQSESASFQQKVKELENKLKEQLQESESHTTILQHKVNELERKLKEQEQNSESCLHQKIKELENKLRVQEQQLQCTHDCTDAVRATPNEGKTCIRDDFMNEIEHRILRSSNSLNRSLNQGSVRGNDSLHETRRKRDQLRSADTENNIFLPSSLNDSKLSRKSDPPKIATRVMRTTKLVTTAQGPLTHKRTSRDQVQGVKERDTKKKIWSR
ncbi:kinesin-like protein KIN-14R [Alnus glutinosa]|uniref:kinesin-like protein KIN-14R n=1 Tax=Alnus glutinosa TaxID=3517 RepID=UPI002D77960E|nr:kinesin-like protein KIN-14R [Alnus glutinosa]